ncbi:helix-turn-helix domain-containing protein [Collimonas sp. NPDC087041]|uniref:helix-turn-helix domain-containing protein n=1 Tax=Collimonas sp. NPDC087041 TaxID=3363960 RepID=UPI00380FDD98
MNSFGDRLREERKKLELSQDAMASAGGVQRLSQINYETGKRSPDWDYLALVAAIGVDVQYVLTGKVSSAELSSDEDELLRGYRCLDIRGKVSVLGMVDGLGTDPSTAVREKQAQLVHTITGKNAQVIQNTGGKNNISTGKTTIKIDRKKKDGL